MVVKNQHLKPRTLLKKIILLEVLLVCILFIWYIHRIDFIQSNLIERKLEDVNVLLDHSFIDTFRDAETIIKYLGKLIMDDGGKDIVYIHSLLSAFIGQNGIINLLDWKSIVWLDSAKNIVESSKEKVHMNIDDGLYKDLIQKSIEYPEKLHVMSNNFSAVTESKILPSALGVIDSQGVYLGTLLVDFEISKFRDRISNLTTFDKSISYIVFDGSGRILLESSDEFVSKNTPEIISDYLNSAPYNTHLLDISDLTFIGLGNSISISKMTGYPYYICVVIHDIFKSESFSLAFEKAFFDFVLILAICIIIVLFIKKSIVLPVVELSRAAAKIVTGKKYIKIQDYNSAELANLSQSLKKLVNQQFELRDANEKLEFLLKQVEAINIAKSRFIRNMQHELRTPLNHIIGGSDVIASEFAGPLQSEYIEYIKIINQSGKNLLNTINNIITVADFESGTIKLDESKCSVKRVIENAIATIQQKLIQNKLTLKLNIQENLPFAYLDAKRFEAAFLSIVNNSIEYNKAGGEVSITAKRLASGIVIEIIDTGVGIANDELSQIERVFQDPGDILAKVHQGVGLGLAIAQHIMSLHDITLKIASEKGVGTTIEITIPNIRIKENISKV